ncbi:ATP-dependent DNA helicase PIF1 [Lactuca sativa]|uniref:ATP-dependent DNA helicase PIF1 n=1 Tax=Lactuca sativa TaxID=4236 RepID=UPI000CD8FF7A|nr:ATP-dependent DNA helicase PIF1 [Lactuca sativa]
MDSDICRDMSTTNITFIADLDVTRDDLSIKVRVINHWKQMSFYNKNEIWSIELILGSKIQASVPKKFLYRFKKKLKDRKSYYITSPSFAALEPNTFSGPKFGFSFVDFQYVLSMVHPQNLSLDVIGLVVAVGEMARESTDKSKHKIYIHIQNENGLEIRLTNSLSKPKSVWENTWEYLPDGILYTQQQRLKSPALSLNEDQIKNLTLFEIEQILLRNNTSLKNYRRMPYPDADSVSSSNNRLITEELDYDIPNLKNEFDRLFVSLTDEQRNIFLDIMTTVKDNKGGVFFIYGYGGTGKTFLWKTISAAIRFKGEIVLNVASSGIASLLLTGGRTVHSRFIIPINLNEDSYYRINPDSDLANLVRKTSLIIWDEAPMVHKHAFEALDRTLKDILRRFNPTNSNTPFGGKVVVFGGDFRQIMPVVPGDSRQNIVNASLSSSEGNLGGLNDGEAIVDIPQDILINDPCYFQERAILSPKNEVVQEINDRLLKLIPGEEKEYLSSDSLCQSEFVHNKVDCNLYSPDKNGLCNGTRLQVKSLDKRVIEAVIISGSNIGNKTFIPRMSLTPTKDKIPFKFQRRQFPLVVCFAMTINKSQGQSLSKVGLFLKEPVFTHGQLLGIVKERFIGVVYMLDTSFLTLKTAIDIVFSNNLSMAHVRGQDYDRASNMSGAFNGLESLIL